MKEKEQAGGVSSWNDLTDKPFYVDGGKTYMLDERTFEGFAVGNMGIPQVDILFSEVGYAFSLAVGETYKVVWDGVEYTTIAQDASALFADGVLGLGNLAMAGLLGNNEPFAIGWSQSGVSFFVVDGSEAAEHRVAIYQGSDPVWKLNEESLPMEAIDARIEEYISAALEGDY